MAESAPLPFEIADAGIFVDEANIEKSSATLKFSEPEIAKNTGAGSAANRGM